MFLARRSGTRCGRCCASSSVCNKRYHKKTTLQDLDAELDLLRCQVRAAKALGYLDIRKYEHWAKLNDEIGRMIGGWIKSMSEPNERAAR